jgi:hypothetical protein
MKSQYPVNQYAYCTDAYRYEHREEKSLSAGTTIKLRTSSSPILPEKWASVAEFERITQI